MNAHTPGPWIVANGKHIIDCKGLELATLPNDDDWEDEHAANARLIAAAPELLDFAKWAIWQLCGYSGTGETHWEQFKEFRKGKDAIAKAEGKQ